ncbi:MAG TPA: ATP-binding protein [Pilimelia sp.]|nr:ATP-binding protein [Pilimelia sp.]
MVESAEDIELSIDQVQSASIVTSSHDAIVGMTRAGEITGCNPAAATLYGALPRDIVGHRVEDFIPHDRRLDEAVVLQRILNGERVEPYRTQRLRPDESVVDVWSSISPIRDSAGAIVGAATVAREVTALQKAFDRFESRVDQYRNEAVDATRRLNLRADQHRTQAQDAAIRYDAQVDQERLQAREAARLSGSAAGLGQEVRLHRAEAAHAVERLERRADQHRTEVGQAADRYEAQVALERTEAQDATDRFEVQVDLERVHAHQAQTEAEAEAIEAQQDKERLQAQLRQNQRLELLGQLAGGVAHDFNNLLAVILNYAAFVVEELSSGSERDLTAAGHDVGQIQRAAERASALTRQLLAFARSEAVQPKVLDLNEVVEEVRQLLARSIGEDIVLRTTLTPGLWPVLADTGQIEQVLVNLAVNARDAMSGGGILTIDTANVTLGADVIAKGSRLCPGRHVRLRVGDTGSGMSPEVLAHIFKPFFTTKAPGTGTGLGLATVYGIVTQLGGTIEIWSHEGLGTTFTIMVPVTNEAAVTVAADDGEQGVGAGETILVVEDEDAMRQVTERILVRGGYHVLTAASGAEAMSIADRYEGDIHLLVTDVVMPHMLGKEVAEKVLARRPNIGVVYMSGYAEPILASRGRLGPDVHILAKPFSSNAIITKVGQVLNRRIG